MFLVDATWSSWGNWSECISPTICGNGTHNRNRTCNTGECGGLETCVIDFFTTALYQNETDECIVPNCVVENGTWSEWTDWANCSVPCGSLGTTNRSRMCNNPAPQNGGLNCTLSDNTTGLYENIVQDCFYYCPGNICLLYTSPSPRDS